MIEISSDMHSLRVKIFTPRLLIVIPFFHTEWYLMPLPMVRVILICKAMDLLLILFFGFQDCNCTCDQIFSSISFIVRCRAIGLRDLGACHFPLCSLYWFHITLYVAIPLVDMGKTWLLDEIFTSFAFVVIPTISTPHIIIHRITSRVFFTHLKAVWFWHLFLVWNSSRDPVISVLRPMFCIGSLPWKTNILLGATGMSVPKIMQHHQVFACMIEILLGRRLDSVRQVSECTCLAESSLRSRSISI